MRYSEFIRKEVVNLSDCKCLGQVNDLVFDECKGRIEAIVLKEYVKCFPFFGNDNEHIIRWDKIVRIGPDVILVDICRKDI